MRHCIAPRLSVQEVCTRDEAAPSAVSATAPQVTPSCRAVCPLESVTWRQASVALVRCSVRESSTSASMSSTRYAIAGTLVEMSGGTW